MCSTNHRIWHITPSAELVSMLARFDADRFLSGPHHDPADVEIDDIFASDFATALRDLMTDARILPVSGVDNQALARPLRDLADHLWRCGPCLVESPASGLRIVSCDHGVVLLAREDDRDQPLISGMFWGHTLIIDEECGLQGAGHGRDLVMARMIQDEALPTWSLDIPSYSRAGAAAVRSACRQICAYENRRRHRDQERLSQRSAAIFRA